MIDKIRPNIAWIVAFGLALLLTSFTVIAMPDWGGYWVSTSDATHPGDAITARMKEKDYPPLNVEYSAKWKVIRDSMASGSIEYDLSVDCSPPGVPYNMSIPYSGEIEMRRDQVTIITEWAGDTRRIYTDGRPHPVPPDLEYTHQGHSIGHWQGNMLVVDTVGIIAETKLNALDMPHSNQLHMTEWIREYKPGFLEIRTRLEDPLAFTKLHEYTLAWKKSPIKNHEISEFICTNNRDLQRATTTPKL